LFLWLSQTPARQKHEKSFEIMVGPAGLEPATKRL
jgi:hypothetical protein